MNNSYQAMMFAREVHKTQRRKYTRNPYADHLAEVAGIVATVADSHQFYVTPETMISVAWLHDCMEDQGITFYELEKRFGNCIATGVEWLSDMESGNRKTRKALARERLAKAPPWIQTIKCADLISNTSSIVMHDPKFAVTYLEEKRLLLEVLTGANHFLRKLALTQTVEI